MGVLFGMVSFYGFLAKKGNQYGAHNIKNSSQWGIFYCLVIRKLVYHNEDWTWTLTKKRTYCSCILWHHTCPVTWNCNSSVSTICILKVCHKKPLRTCSRLTTTVTIVWSSSPTSITSRSNWINRNSLRKVVCRKKGYIYTTWSWAWICLTIRIVCTDRGSNSIQVSSTTSITTTLKVSSKRWEESSSKDTDNRDNDHKFHKGKTTRREFHRKRS